MKKLSIALLCVVWLFTACDKEEKVENPFVVPTAGEFSSPNHFYGIGRLEGRISSKGVAQRDNLWYPGSIIVVRLLNDPYNKAEEIKTYAAEWEKHADIKFKFVEKGDAHVRIGFDWNDERYITWSYTGTDCKMVTGQDEATMSFAFWDSANGNDRKADVLRAFGQVLGLELEHRHLEFDPKWTSRIADYWEGEVEDIPWENLKKYVFDPLEKENVITTDDYDEESIMIWPFHHKYATNTARSSNYALSQGDIAFINKLYPKETNLVRMETSALSVSFGMRGGGEITIDWGDGQKEVVKLYEVYPQEFSHQYDSRPTDGPYVIKMSGDVESIIHMNCSENELTSLDLSYCAGLKSLVCERNKLTSLNLSNSPRLTVLKAASNQINYLDISKCNKLEYVDIRFNWLTEKESYALQFAELVPSVISVDALMIVDNSLFVAWAGDIVEAKNWNLSVQIFVD